MMRTLPPWARRLSGAALAACLAVALAVAFRSGSRPTSTTAAPRASGASIVVRAGNADSMASIETHALRLGYSIRQRESTLHALSLSAPAGFDAAEAITDFALFPGVVYAEPAYSMTSLDVPTDALFERQSYLEKVHAPEAWAIETGSAEIIVAVLDTGVDIAHPDLTGRFWTNQREVADNAIDDDNNNCVDDRHGCAFVTDAVAGCDDAEGGAIDDDWGHGTFVAGIIAANANEVGIVGVARGVTIMPVKVLDCLGGGNSIEVAIGVIYAARNGARIINVSLGGDIDSAFLREAVRIAHDEFGALVVAASGNSGGETVWFPARYDQALAVGASNASGTTRAPFSTAGPQVDVVAIGENIIGTVPVNTCRVFLPCIGGAPYAIASGTSFSAPQVSGLAALMLSRRPDLTVDAIVAAIKASADTVGLPGQNWAGAGRINMEKALTPGFRIGAPGTARN